MPDVVISDPGPGFIEVQTGIPVKVLGTDLYISVVVGADVAVVGVNMWLRVRLEFNGGSASPTILAANPPQFWGTDPWNLDPNFSIQAGSNVPEFVVQWSHSSYVPPTTDPILNEIVGSSFNSVSYTGFNSGSTVDVYGFVFKLDGTSVYPDDGDSCVLTIRYS